MFILSLHKEEIDHGMLWTGEVLNSGICPLTTLSTEEPTLSSTPLSTAVTYGINCANERNHVATVGGNQPKQIGGEMRDCETEGSCLNLEVNENCLGQNQCMRQIKEIKYLEM